MKERRISEIKGVIGIAVALIIFASLISFTPFDLSFYTSHPNIPPKNFIRTFGAYLAGLLLFLFGWSSYIIPLFILLLGLGLFQHEKPNLRLARILGIAVLLLSVSSLIGIMGWSVQEPVGFSRSGFLGFMLSKLTVSYFGKLGGNIIFITLIILSLALVTEHLISTLLLGMINRANSTLRSLRSLFKKKELGVRISSRPVIKAVKEKQEKEPRIAGIKIKPVMEDISLSQPRIKLKPQGEIKPQPLVSEPKIRTETPIKVSDYNLPSLDLLESPPPFEARQIKEDLAANARILEETLEDFGISVKVTDIERGPVITRYELEPAPGVKLNRIVTLSDDIALAMKAQSVRIIAPIPGKGRVGVEVPNTQSSFVYLKEVLASDEFKKAESILTLALGKDITGKPIVANLNDMPHLLIAGTTGSGKTVCVNSLILALLFKAAPHELKFVMIDPKMVELASFNGLPHLLCPVVTEAKKASHALSWAVNEMEERYKLLAKVGVRNIEAYNEREEPIPYIVVIIDEFADLMTVAADQIENAVTRLAQLSRAVGIHLILATQRPSVNVITGVIKANLPARISFKVASKVDSRTVLDMNGADKLLGKGDMLFLRPGESKLIRIQGTLVDDKEIERVVGFIKSQAEPFFDEDILKEEAKSVLANGQKDELYNEAVRIIMESNQASVSILQRRLRLGYTRAARIIDTMEQGGFIGPFEGSKPRKILVDREAWLQEDLMRQASE